MAAIGAGLKDGTSEQTKVNLPPRLRMATLYAVAQSLPNGGRVANTCNMSEDYVGYSTKFGDSAGDFSPLANLTVHEVRQIGYELPVPKELVDKTPADGLCGKTDEDNLGFTYAQLDSFIENGTCGIMSIDYTMKDLTINGKDIMSFGVPEGRLVGDTLRHILNMVINGEISNEIEPQMQAAQQYLAVHSYE